MPDALPVIQSCDGCGACCLAATAPPFRRAFGDDGQEDWGRLRRERPDLADEILAAERVRRACGDPSYGTPCLWFDAETRRCRHYGHRPLACRVFEIGCGDCRDMRRRAGVGGTR